MAHNPIDEIPAGRELDARIHRKIFGVTNPIYYDMNHPEWPRRDVPAYSTDWKAAGLVLEQIDLFGDGDSIFLEKSRNGYRVGAISTVGQLFDRFHGGDDVPFSETGPLAICRAALSAKAIHA